MDKPVVLTDTQLDFLARTAAWKFDVSVKDERGADDSCIYTGDGVDDLDRLITMLDSKQILGSTVSRAKVVVDVGRTFSNYIIVTVSDVRALRQKFIDIWGTVAKPEAFFDVPLSQATKELEGEAQGGIIPGIAIENPEQDPALGPGLPAGITQESEFEDLGDGRTNIAPRPQPDQNSPI